MGGALYSRFGYRGPFIFSICATFIDLIGRLVLIERKDAVLWGVDPASDDSYAEASASASDVQQNGVNRESSPEKENGEGCFTSKGPQSIEGVQNVPAMDTTATVTPSKPISFVKVIGLLGRSKRAAGSFFITLIYG